MPSNNWFFESLKYISDIICRYFLSSQIKEQKIGDYSIMFGPSDDDLLAGFINVAQGNKLPLINYRITDSKYANNVGGIL